MKVCITTAGTGSRMGPYACINKALLPVSEKAAISHIIESFPGSEFVIALGHLGQQVRDYLAIAHPDLWVEFVEVSAYEGPGTGPLRSLWECRNHLRSPFYFVPCDTLLEANFEDNAGPENVVFCGSPDTHDLDGYSYANVDSTALGLIITDMFGGGDKNGLMNCFTGLLKISDFDVFWQCATDALEAGEVEIFHAVKRLLKVRPILARFLRNWRDIGTLNRYQRVIADTVNFDFSKPNEFLFRQDNKVIKWFADPEIAAKRVARAEMRPQVFPRITDHREGFFAYDFIEGATFYERSNARAFGDFLNWGAENLWRKTDADISAAMEKFYVDKTLERVALFRKKHPDWVEPRTVNEEEVLSLDEILERVDLSGIASTAVPSFVHGDLQFDHVLRTQEGFKLIDWRQDFGGRTDLGDLYYDFAKLLGGIRLNYRHVKRNQISFEGVGDVRINVTNDIDSADCERVLMKFISDNGYSTLHTEKVLGVIYLNMAPLHHSPFDFFLYALAQRSLTRVLR